MKSLLVSAWKEGLLASAPTFLFNKGTTPSNSGLCTFPGWTILHTSLYYLYLREGNLVIHHPISTPNRVLALSRDSISIYWMVQ